MTSDEWPKWAVAAALETQRLTPLWRDAFDKLHDAAVAHEGQMTQLAYPFSHVVLAKMLCERAGDNSRLFMDHMSAAFQILEGGQP